MKEQLRGSEARIDVCGVAFRVRVGASGLQRLELPPLDDGIRRAGSTLHPRVAIDREGTDTSEAACLAVAGVFLADLLAGRPPSMLPETDLNGVSDFTRRVLEVVRLIPFGATVSYAEVAASAGAPGAARAIGGAVGRNPIPLVIPCHRVVRSDGGTGGWSGAPGWKEWLLEHERAAAEVGTPPA